VVVTTLGGYWSCHIHQSFSTTCFLMMGTFMQAAAANSINQVLEIERDGLMTRTHKRPLPTTRISKLHSILQALLIGTTGTLILYYKVNPLTSLLGLSNILIYTSIYTPWKIFHWSNTWIGTITGSIPPLMGAVAALNELWNPLGLFCFGSLFFWQIPHFMAICYKCRSDYERAGYEMLAIRDPKKSSHGCFIPFRIDDWILYREFLPGNIT